jgi:hypothetical protein
VPTSKRLLGGILGCLVVFGFNESVSAQSSDASTAAIIEARARETNRSLLAALIERRKEVERTAAAGRDMRLILYHLDKRIAQVRSQIE